MLRLKDCHAYVEGFSCAYVGGLKRNVSKHFRRYRHGTEVLMISVLSMSRSVNEGQDGYKKEVEHQSARSISTHPA